MLKISHTSLLSVCLTFILLSGVLIVNPTFAAKNHLKGKTINIPDDPITPPNQEPLSSIDHSDIADGLKIPKNLIVPTCTSGTTNVGNDCPPVVGTDGDDIIMATNVPSATVYGLDGNDVVQCGSFNCKVYGGSGDNLMTAGSSTTAQLFGGDGNNVFVGGSGDTLMVGGKGDDQEYAGGTGNDVMIGGGGKNYFDCGASGNGIILDFDPKNGDTKASNCKYAITENTNIPPLP